MYNFRAQLSILAQPAVAAFATGAGIFLILNYYIVAWGLVWLISFAIKRKVLLSNTVATALIPFTFFWL
jgi:hypothetical protein